MFLIRLKSAPPRAAADSAVLGRPPADEPAWYLARRRPLRTFACRRIDHLTEPARCRPACEWHAWPNFQTELASSRLPIDPVSIWRLKAGQLTLWLRCVADDLPAGDAVPQIKSIQRQSLHRLEPKSTRGYLVFLVSSARSSLPSGRLLAATLHAFETPCSGRGNAAQRSS
jgi:hypothetical protein